MKVAYVTPRYGAPEQIGGGAEGVCRMFAERVAAGGWDVEVLTTTARSPGDWRNEYPAGATVEGGVNVRRFPLAQERGPEFHTLLQRIIQNPRVVSEADQQAYIDDVGPYAPELLDALADTNADLVSFTPYLFYPSIRGIPLVRGRAVFQPAAHDEPMIRFPFFADLFNDVEALLFFTPAEQRLVRDEFGLDDRPQTIIGIGVEEDTGAGADPSAFRTAHGLGDDPYLLCLGRMSKSKSTESLARFFTAYKNLRGGRLRLVFAGKVEDEPPAHQDIVVVRGYEEQDKWDALAGATALVSPSYYESLSLVLIEAWAVGLPAIVNARCDVTATEARRARGALTFDGFASFVAAVDRLLSDGALAAGLGAAGKRYVDERYRWPHVMDHYRRFLDMVATRATRLTPGARPRP